MGKESDYMPRISLKSARVNAGLTQKQAADALEIASSTLRNWEKGITFPKQPEIEKMCVLYKVSYDQVNFYPQIS